MNRSYNFIARSHVRVLILTASILPLAGCPGGGGNSAPAAGGNATPAPTTGPTATPLPVAGTFDVMGRVDYQGTAPIFQPIQTAISDPKCAMHGGGTVMPDKFMVSPTGGFKNVFVYVKDPPAGTYAAPSAPVLLDQVGCMYEPHVFGVMKDQGIVIRNSDNTMHNIHASGKRYVFNEGQARQGMTKNVTTPRAELEVPIKCDVHPWMKAYMHVMDHPFFALTDANGDYKIDNLPPGTYTLVYWHEDPMLNNIEVQITITDADLAGTNVTFK